MKHPKFEETLKRFGEAFLPHDIVLASASVHRRELLRNAGLDVAAEPSGLDERVVEAPLKGSGASPEEIAEILAEAKATDVSARMPGKLVIGADQVLSLGDEVLHKPADMEEARRQLLKLSGRTHQLSTAVCLAEGGAATWRHLARASITVRTLSPVFVGRYLAAVGDRALGSVGCYQIEREGVQLVEGIEGDFFAIVGLPVLPLLAELRRRGAIDG